MRGTTWKQAVMFQHRLMAFQETTSLLIHALYWFVYFPIVVSCLPKWLYFTGFEPRFCLVSAVFYPSHFVFMLTLWKWDSNRLPPRCRELIWLQLWFPAISKSGCRINLQMLLDNQLKKWCMMKADNEKIEMSTKDIQNVKQQSRNDSEWLLSV